MKVLVIRFSSIGDIVLTTPVVRALKTQLRAEVHYATKKQYATLLASNPHIDKVHLLSGKLNELSGELKRESFDYIIDLHNNLRTFILKLQLRRPSGSFRKLNFEKWLMVNFRINRLPDVHIVERYLQAGASLGIKDDGLGLDYFVAATEEVTMELLPASHRNGFVAYAIGGQHATKKMPVERMIELCIRIGGPVILLGGKEDEANGERIRLFLEQAPHATSIVFNGCGKFSIGQSASILKQSHHVFTHDTGMMHIASALQKEVYAIWGNTIPAFGMTPYRTKFTNLENNGLSCRPCSKIGYERCPRGHFKCMKEIDLSVAGPMPQ